MPARKYQQKAVLCALTLVAVLCVTHIHALKELPVNTVFAQPVQDAVSCEVNSAVVMNLNRQAQTMRESLEAKRLHVREDDVLAIMEHVCNPFRDEGAWVRQMTFEVAHDAKDPSRVAASGPVLTVKVLPQYTKCKRTCATVRTMCERFLDSQAADDLSAVVLRALKAFNDLSSDDATRAILGTVCHPSDYCQSQKAYQDWLRGLAKIEGYTALNEVEEDVPEEISPDDMQVEQMMAGTFAEKGQKTSVFAREEIKKLHVAIAKGDRELAESLDPSMRDLSPEEFEELQTIFADESPYAGDDFENSDL